jgi:hypothetical protein
MSTSVTVTATWSVATIAVSRSVVMLEREPSSIGGAGGGCASSWVCEPEQPIQPTAMDVRQARTGCATERRRIVRTTVAMFGATPFGAQQDSRSAAYVPCRSDSW